MRATILAATVLLAACSATRDDEDTDSGEDTLGGAGTDSADPGAPEDSGTGDSRDTGSGDSGDTGEGGDSGDTGDSGTLPAVVDLLFVIDDSCSMSSSVVGSGSLATALLSPLVSSSASWHVGVTTTDGTDADARGTLRKAGAYAYVDETTPNPVAVLAQLLDAGTDGSSAGEGLAAVERAIGQPTSALQTANAGFYRPDAALHVLVLSDSDDASTPGPSASALVTTLQQLKSPASIPVTFSAIVGPSPGGCASITGQADAAPAYLAVAAALGGETASFCDAAAWTTTVGVVAGKAVGALP